MEAEPSAAAVGRVAAPADQAEGVLALRAAFYGGDDPYTLLRGLATPLDAGRDAWPLSAIRSLWDVLWTLEPKRERSPAHEGTLLEPCFRRTVSSGKRMVSWDGVCRLQPQGACPGGARASASARFSIIARNRGEKTHYAASLVSAADQQVRDDTRVVLEDLITEPGVDWPISVGWATAPSSPHTRCGAGGASC